MNDLKEIKGIDIYLIDQILKGTYQQTDKILDAGCGTGRNMKWFANNGLDIYGCDIKKESVEKAINNTKISSDKFEISPIEKMPYSNHYFDHIIVNAVLHFANSTQHFMEMLQEIKRVLKPNGTVFIRMTSTFGLPNNQEDKGNGCYLLKDGSIRFLLTKDLLTTLKKEFGFEQIEHTKSTLVEELRSMTTLILKKKNLS